MRHEARMTIPPSRKPRSFIATMALAATLLTPLGPAAAQEREIQQRREGVTLNFQDVDLAYV